MADESSNLAESLDAEDLLAAEEVESTQGQSRHGDSDDRKQKDRNLDLIIDIPLRVTVELGRTKMVVSELLNLGQGSVIELNKLAGEPMEVLVNDKLVARGEAVVVNEKFGIRLTDIISPTERVEQLK